MPASYTSEPLLVRAGRACGLHGPHHGDHEHGQDSKGGQNPGQNQGPGQDEAGVGVPTPAGVRAAWLVPAVSVPGLVPGASAGPVWVAEVERVRAAARDERVPAEAVLVAERLTRTARQALARLDSLGAARRSGQDAVHAVLAAAATSLETFVGCPPTAGTGRLPRPIPGRALRCGVWSAPSPTS